MRMRRMLLRRIHFIAVLASALLVLGVVTATTANAGTAPTGWGSTRQVALATFNGTVYMAWIDPHVNNELTISSTTDGVHWAHGTHPLGSGNSDSAPALTVFNGRLWLAWTGTDGNSTLNLAYSANGVNFTQENLPLGRNNSPDGPAMTVFNGKLYYAWRGTDGNHTLNLVSSANGSTFTAPIQPDQVSTINAPALATWAGKLYVAWAGSDFFHLVGLASSADGVNFTPHQQLNLGSNFQPSMVQNISLGALEIVVQNASADLTFVLYNGQSTVVNNVFPIPIVQAPAITADGFNLMFAWLGTDPGHTINVCYTSASQQDC